MTALPPPPYCIEPFDVMRHNRAGFDCGIVPVDNFFKKTANKLAQAGNIRLGSALISRATSHPKFDSD